MINRHWQQKLYMSSCHTLWLDKNFLYHFWNLVGWSARHHVDQVFQKLIYLRCHWNLLSRNLQVNLNLIVIFLISLLHDGFELWRQCSCAGFSSHAEISSFGSFPFEIACLFKNSLVAALDYWESQLDHFIKWIHHGVHPSTDHYQTDYNFYNIN